MKQVSPKRFVTLYNSIYVTFLKGQEYSNRKQVSCCQHLTIKPKGVLLGDVTILILGMTTQIHTGTKIHITDHQKCHFYYILL